MVDFLGDKNGKGIVEEFRKLLVQEAELFQSKGTRSFDDCLKFLLEEYAHAVAFLKNRLLIYPRVFLIRC